MLEPTMLYDIDAVVYNKAKKIKRLSLFGTVTGVLISIAAGLVGIYVGEKIESKGIECIGD